MPTRPASVEALADDEPSIPDPAHAPATARNQVIESLSTCCPTRNAERMELES